MLLPFVFLVLFRDRRRMVHSSVTEHPSAEWTGRQLVAAFPRDTVPRYLIRDRDGIYGQDFTRCVPRGRWSAPMLPAQRSARMNFVVRTRPTGQDLVSGMDTWGVG